MNVTALIISIIVVLIAIIYNYLFWYNDLIIFPLILGGFIYYGTSLIYKEVSLYQVLIKVGWKLVIVLTVYLTIKIIYL
ncbi:hypothetical protein [Halothermothrix orenii]|uniref:hypothetical protein n=1 Tax=Halothermothrix orenii TaxID=31909 RepID=UPI00030E70B8|nr:hypothetical protein [Halothermothrix orenii]